MLPPFDIFRQEQDGKVLWLGTASSLAEAEERVAEAMNQERSDHLIVSLKTGKRQTVSPNLNRPSLPS